MKALLQHKKTISMYTVFVFKFTNQDDGEDANIQIICGCMKITVVHDVHGRELF